MHSSSFEASIDTHILGHAQDRLAIDPGNWVTPYAHNHQARSLPQFLHSVAHLAAHLRLHLRAHGPSIQNLCGHAHSPTRVVARWLPIVMPASRLPSRELNMSTRSASFIACTSRRTIQQAPAPALEASIAPITRRHEPFVHKVLACQMITSICSKEIQPHPLQFFIPIGLQRLPCFIVLPGVTLFLYYGLVAMTARKLFCKLSDVLTEAGCILLKGIIK